MALSPGRSSVLFVTFNQDSTCIALGCVDGLLVYNVETHKLCFRHAIGALSLVEMLFCTSLVGYVGAGEQPALTPRKLTVYNTTANRVISELSYPTSVLAVRMNRQRLVVVTQRRVHVYSMANLACLRAIDTEDNPKGCCAVTAGTEPNLLALPSSATTGTVRIYDLSQDGGNVLSEAQAHQAPVTIMAWNHDGTLLATASAKGTVIRVHRPLPATATGGGCGGGPAAAAAPRPQSFRRGAASAAVQSLAFSPTGLPGGVQLLCASSSRGTVHVYRVTDPDQLGPGSRAPAPLGLGTLGSSPAGAAVGGFLAAVVRHTVADMLEPARDIATIRLPHAVGITCCAFRQTQPSHPPATAGSSAQQGGSPAPGRGSSADGGGLATGGGGASMADSQSEPDWGAAGGGGDVAGESRGPGDWAAGFAGTAGRGRAGGEEGLEGRGAEEARAVVLVATQEGLLYEYGLSDLLNPQGPKCCLEGEWSLLGSGSVAG